MPAPPESSRCKFTGVQLALCLVALAAWVANFAGFLFLFYAAPHAPDPAAGRTMAYTYKDITLYLRPPEHWFFSHMGTIFLVTAALVMAFAAWGYAICWFQRRRRLAA